MLRITKLRNFRALSKAQLARLAEIDQGQISKIESGRVKPYPCELRRLSKALGLPTSESEKLLEEDKS